MWELSRLWAPDGHEKNLLTQAISSAINEFKKIEPSVICLVSYADPNVGHSGGVYKAASWIFCGQCEESRYYEKEGQCFSRRKFHSGSKGMTKWEIQLKGFKEVKRPGKLRFAKPLNKKARRILNSFKLK